MRFEHGLLAIETNGVMAEDQREAFLGVFPGCLLRKFLLIRGAVRISNINLFTAFNIIDTNRLLVYVIVRRDDITIVAILVLVAFIYLTLISSH